jgi:hypothetical protein
MDAIQYEKRGAPGICEETLFVARQPLKLEGSFDFLSNSVITSYNLSKHTQHSHMAQKFRFFCPCTLFIPRLKSPSKFHFQLLLHLLSVSSLLVGYEVK